jgi:transposase-like protein
MMPKARQAAPYLTRRRWTIDEARAALEAQSASGLSVRAFAQREGLDAQRLFRWRRIVARAKHGSAAPLTFVEVKQPRHAEPIEVVLSSGRILRVTESVDPDALARIADALDKDRPC